MSALRRLAGRYGTREDAVDDLLRASFKPLPYPPPTPRRDHRRLSTGRKTWVPTKNIHTTSSEESNIHCGRRQGLSSTAMRTWAASMIEGLGLLHWSCPPVEWLEGYYLRASDLLILEQVPQSDKDHDEIVDGDAKGEEIRGKGEIMKSVLRSSFAYCSFETVTVPLFWR